jgi:nicotinamidase/pyrazinamidase
MKTVFFDVDTQIDFLYPAGALYAPGAERVVSNVAALNRYAASQGSMVISTMDAHSEDDPEFKTWPHHCVVETAGQQKPVATLLDKRVVVPNRAGDVAIEGSQQILLEKQTVDCFTSMHLAGLLEKLGAERYVVYGVVTEVCVKNAAFGLLKMSKTGNRVEIVTDAVRALNESDGAKVLADFSAAGGVLSTVAQVTSKD